MNKRAGKSISRAVIDIRVWLRKKQKQQELTTEQFEKSIPSEEHGPSTAEAELTDTTALFNEDNICVTPSHIIFGRYTYVVKYLAAIQRIDKEPSHWECRLGFIFSIVALLCVLAYIFTGRLKFGFSAVIYLFIPLSMLPITALVCRKFKPSYRLEFINHHGEKIKIISSDNKEYISRLEHAVKKAISLSHDV
jgi:hypothetical protein